MHKNFNQKQSVLCNIRCKGDVMLTIELKMKIVCTMEKNDEKYTRGQVIVHVIGLIIVYAFLIFTTGVIAFYYYHPLGAGEGLKQTSNFIKNYWNSFNNPKETGLPPLNETSPPSAPLPSKECPELEPVCAIEVCNCPAQSESPCPAPPPHVPCTQPDCPKGTCRESVTCPENPVPIQAFRVADWLTRELPDWYSLYPPFSPERLEVVTSLLGFSYDKFAFDGVLSNTQPLLEGVKAEPCEVCPIINNKTDPQYRGSVLPFKSEKGYALAHALMGHLTAVGPMYVKRFDNDVTPIDAGKEERASDTRKADPVNKFIAEVIKSYEVTRSDGLVCKVCVNFDPDYWKKCKKTYSLDRNKFRPEQ